MNNFTKVAACDPHPDVLNELVGKMLGDLGGAYSVPTVRIGF